jgi:uncharacterized membrane protein
MNRDASRQALGVLAVLPWLATRLGWFSTGAPAANGLVIEGRLWPFFFIDQNALWLLLAGAIWLLYEPSKRSAWAIVALLTLSNAWVYATESLIRYYAGFASAYDLANYIQPLWRASTGQSMAGTWLGDMPIWADHGSFALVFFVPFARLFSDAGSGVLLVQALLAAAWMPAVYALARAVGLASGIALLVTCAAAASRAIFHAVGYDFHPECAMPLLLIAAVAAHERGRFVATACCVVLAALLKDMAALTVGMAMLYLAIARRDRRCLALSALAFGIAMIDMFALPSLTGAVSYVGMYAGHHRDYGLALATTGLRALTTMLLGWMHPFAWFAGAPWMLAAGLSAKVAVKTVFYQYGFMHVPVAIAGATYALAAVERRKWPVKTLALVWTLATVTVNAQDQLHTPMLGTARAQFDATRAHLTSPPVAPPGVNVATDACLAPYLMERTMLAGLCVLDIPEFSRSGREQWTWPSPYALRADRIVIDTSCPSHGACIDQQIELAKKQGFREGVHGPRLRVLIRR